jgi:hypothetical protein
MKGRAGLLLILAIPLLALGQADLPESDGDDSDSFEVEPPLLLPNRDPGPAVSIAGQSATSVRDPVELEKLVERAKRLAIEAEKLYKRGVLSRVEVELRQLRIIRLQSDLEKARLERAKAELAIAQTQFEMNEISKEALASVQQKIEIAERTAEAASLARDRAEIVAAETNLKRQRKLAELGSARPSDVAKAERRLADLKAGHN